MRVLIVAEGKHERSGALENLVRRLRDGEELKFETDSVNRADLHAFHGSGQGFFKRSMRWLLEAKNRGYDALVFVIDEDGHSERSSQLDKAQSDELARLPRALGVAVRAFDAWMLADERALTEVLGVPVQRQRNPESISNPKQQCADLLSESSHRLSQTDMYTAVANAANLATVVERCPKGFGPFADRVKKNI